MNVATGDGSRQMGLEETPTPAIRFFGDDCTASECLDGCAIRLCCGCKWLSAHVHDYFHIYVVATLYAVLYRFWAVGHYLSCLRGAIRILLGFAAVGKLFHNDAVGHNLSN